MSKTLLWSLAGLAAGILLAVAGGLYFFKPYTYHGSLINPPFAAPDFTLTDQNGQAFQLGAQKGKVVLLYFGYTNCPDVCPITLANLKQARSQLGSQAGQVKVVFVTVDPQRDDAARLNAYLAGFDPSFTGLTGSPEALQPVWKSYGVLAQVTQDSSGLEQVEHSSQVYVIDQSGEVRLTFPYGLSVSDMASDVQHLLKGG